MSTLAGVQLLLSEIHWPEFGSWRVDATGTEGDTLASRAKATYSNGTLAMIGKVKRSGFDTPDRPHTVLWGGLGWHDKVATPISFQSDSGVRLSTVLKALATAAGEPFEQPKDVTIGSYYECLASRPSDPITYADALNDLARSGRCPPWRVDADGVTRFGARTAKEVTGNTRATVLSPNRGVGVTVYGIDDPALFIPGNTIDGIPIRRVEVQEEKGKLTARVYTADAIPPVRELVRQMIRSELIERVRTYVVVERHADGRCDLSPPPDAPHLPELRNVEQWAMGSIINRAQKGDEVLVVYADPGKTKPRIFGFKLRGGPFSDIAAAGNSVSVFFPPECPIVGMVNGTTPFAGTITILDNAIGQIDDGSSKGGIEQ